MMPAIERYFASQLPDGSVFCLGLANRLGNVVVPLLLTGLVTPLFPRLSLQAAHGDRAGACATLSLTLRLFLVAAVPLVVFAPLYGPVLLEIIFQRGRLSAADVGRIAEVLPWYSLSMTSAAVGTILGRGFYGLLKDTLSGTIIGVVLVPFYALLCICLVRPLGYLGLAVAHSAYWFSLALVGAIVLRRRLGGRGGGAMLRTLVSCAGAALATYVVLRLALNAGWSGEIRLVLVATAFPVYLFLAWFVFGVREIDLVGRRLLDLMRGRPAGSQVLQPQITKRAA